MWERFLPRRHSGWIVALCLMLCPWPAAGCAARLGVLAVTPIVYDPFENSPASGTVRVGVDLIDDAACDVAVRLTDDTGAPLRNVTFGSARQLSLVPRLRTAPSVRASVDDSEALVALTTEQRHVDVEWRLDGRDDTVLPAGDYSQPIRVRMLVAGEDPPALLGAITLSSIPRAQLNLSLTPGPFAPGSDTATIDLGELHTGSTGHAFVQLRANTSARMTFSSKNRGFLRHSSGTETIPYSLSLDGVIIPLDMIASQPAGPTSNRRGDVQEIVVTVGRVSAQSAGRYSDTVSIEISP